MFDLQGSWISPHYLHDHIDLLTASIEDRIAVFEDRIRGYFTTPARLLANVYENSILLTLLAVLGCIELIETLHRGESSRRRSQEFFVSGFRRVFNPQPPPGVSEATFEKHLQTMLKAFYIQVRCGLMHIGTTRSKVLISKELQAPAAIRYNATQDRAESITINPDLSLLALEMFVSEYCRDLRDRSNEELRRKFEEGWLALRSDG